MKILFVENRFRTRIWEAFADCLINDGHQVLFLVQNHLFHPRCGRVWVIPYPNKTQLEELTKADRSLILSDRNINYFGHRSTGHYTYYRKLIRDFLEKERPDVTFGESTAFHELQTIDLCRELSIPYLQPSTCRFPPGRFSFYRYDTLEPFSGSGETMSDEQAIKLINSIVHRTIKLDYMQKYRATLSTRLKRWNDLIHLSVAYLGGEHYNTPAPWVKLRIERQRRKLIRKWNALAESRNVVSFKNSFRLLYPMQMQPEANLDVWGRPYRNQLEMLHHLYDCLPAGAVIFVKPNPKSKYELTEELLAFIASHERIVPLCHSIRMDEVLPNVNMVVTVTGTIAIECILADIPVVTMVRTLNNDMKNCPFAASFEELRAWMDKVPRGEFPRTDTLDKIRFINRLNNTSFPGIPYETVLNEQNVETCMMAFRKVLKELNSK